MQTNLTIEDVEELIDERLGEYKQEIDSLKKEIDELSKQQYSDNESPTRKVDVHDRELLRFGNSYLSSITNRPAIKGDFALLATGPSRDEQLDRSFQKTSNSAISLIHFDKNVVGGFSRFVGEASDSYINLTGTANISGNTITDDKFKFETNELISNPNRTYVCNIYDDGSLVSAHNVTSNTNNTINLDGSPNVSGKFGYALVATLYLGFTDVPFQRAYVNNGLSGGIRFGIGPTGQGGNGLLYTNGNNLIFRNNLGVTTTIA